MMITISLKNNRLTDEEEQWLAKNVGPRMHYTHQSIGGQGWIAKRTYVPEGTDMVKQVYTLTLEDDRYATLFKLMFS